MRKNTCFFSDGDPHEIFERIGDTFNENEQKYSVVEEAEKCESCDKDELGSHKAAGCAKQFVCKTCNVDCLDYDGRWRHEIQFHR